MPRDTPCGLTPSGHTSRHPSGKGATVKIATNRRLAERKPSWIDFNASPTLEGESLENELYDYVIRVAEGELTKNEINGYKEISIFKDGVTL